MEGYFVFSRTKVKPIKELSAYYGNVGKRVNSLFLEGKYLSKLTDDEITALSIYTKEHFTEINFVFR